MERPGGYRPRRANRPDTPLSQEMAVGQERKNVYETTTLVGRTEARGGEPA